MSIATVITGGFGSFGSIAEVVTFGYGIGEAPVTVQQVGGASYLTREEYEEALARYRKLENARKRARKKSKETIRQAVIDALNPSKPAPEPESAPVAPETIVADVPEPTYTPITVSKPDPRLQAILDEMKALRSRIAEYEADQLAEADDEEIFLMLVH